MDYRAELDKTATEGVRAPQQPYRSLIPFILTQEELSKQDIPPREYLLSEWMPKDSFGMVYAPRGVGKSWFCMALGVAVSEGKKRFLGWYLCAQHDVLSSVLARMKESSMTELRYKILGRNWLKDLQPPSYLIPRILPDQGLVTLVVEPSSKKSFLAVHIVDFSEYKNLFAKEYFEAWIRLAKITKRFKRIKATGFLLGRWRQHQ